MTVKGLSDFLHKKKLPIVGRRTKDIISTPYYLKQLKGLRVSIETAGIIYNQNWASILYVIGRHRFTYDPITGWDQPSMNDLLDRFRINMKGFITRLVSSGIIPVFIIEGKSPIAKKQTAQDRSDDKNDSLKECLSHKRNECDIGTYIDKLKYTYYPNAQHAQITIDILIEMNLITLRAHHEAEGVCGHLVYNKDDPFHCDIAMCDDYDIFMYGPRVVIRNLRSSSASNGYFEIEGYAFCDILYTLGFIDHPSTQLSDEEMKRVYDRYILFCILCGTDYTDNVYGMGPGKLSILFKKHNIYTFEEICAIDPRFSKIPYHLAINTIKENTKYTILNDGSTK